MVESYIFNFYYYSCFILPFYEGNKFLQFYIESATCNLKENSNYNLLNIPRTKLILWRI